jgi:hypothetical protein
MKALLLTLLLAGLYTTGCTGHKSIYGWGNYEPLIYASYTEPEKAAPEIQVVKLAEDLEKAKAKNKPVHPGFHAHLGYLYYQLGKAEDARRAFETEKANFPESAVFMDRLIANLKKP